MFANNISLLSSATLETIYMVIVSGVIAMTGGIPLGVILFVTRQGGIIQSKLYNLSLGFIVNIIRSIPFIILLVAVVPFTRLIIGTSIGVNAAIIPLSIAAIPFVARITENALMKVNKGLIEAGNAMGATSLQIIKKILLPEAMPGIVNGITITWIAIVGYSAMAGAVGGGGLGSVAINYGYQRFEPGIMFVTVLILIVIVHIIQYIGDRLARRLTH